MNAARLRSTIRTATALAWVAASGCGDPAADRGQPASSGTPGSAASDRRAPPIPVQDAPPPAWLPPGYTEIPWEKAAEVIHRRDVDRVILTQTRRAYVVT